MNRAEQSMGGVLSKTLTLFLCVASTNAIAEIGTGLSVPATSTTGDYTVTWNGGPNLELQESAGGGPFLFVSWSMEGVASFTGKADGTYTYRNRLRICPYGCYYLYSAPQSIVVSIAPAEPPPEVAGFGEGYSAFGGDVDSDGDTDIHVRSDTVIVPDPYVTNFLLRNNSDGTFSIESNLTATEQAIVDSWSQNAASLLLGDYDVDGIVDVFLELDDALFGSGADDIIVYASEITSQPPISLVVLDDEFKEFIGQLNSWIENPNYFDENAPTITVSLPETTGEGWYYYATSSLGLNAALIACSIDHNGNCAYYIGYLRDVFSVAECNSLAIEGISCDVFGAHVFGFTVTTVFVDVDVPDYSVFNQDALALAQGALAAVMQAEEIVAGSPEAQEIVDILESYLGSVLMDGVLTNPGQELVDEDEFPDDILDYMRWYRLFKRWFPDLGYLADENRPPTGPAQLLLTFDDGPVDENGSLASLNSILATLALSSISAEFYVVGNEVPPNAAETQAILAAGHTVQNHSENHPEKFKDLTLAEVQMEIGDAQQGIIAAVNVAPTKFRPPYGSGGFAGNIDPEIASVSQSLGLAVVNWDVDTKDWQRPRGVGPSKIAYFERDVALASALGRPEPFVVLLHVRPETAEDLPAFIAYLILRGYTFASP